MAASTAENETKSSEAGFRIVLNDSACTVALVAASCDRLSHELAARQALRQTKWHSPTIACRVTTARRRLYAVQKAVTVVAGGQAKYA